MRFKDRVVMISGAASGFGRLAARRFSDEGARLALADLDAEGLASTYAMLRGDGAAISCQIDVSVEDDHRRWVAETLAAFDGLDIALNNAGVMHPLARLTETPVEEFDRMMAINARGVFLAMKHQIPAMTDLGRGGAILNVASVAGLIGAQRFGAYVASKHAVVGLTRTAALEAGRHGIRVNAICPAFTESPMLEEISDQMRREDDTNRSETYARMGEGLALSRIGTTEEIVTAMLALCDPANTFMTGQAVAVDGGLTAT